MVTGRTELEEIADRLVGKGISQGLRARWRRRAGGRLPRRARAARRTCRPSGQPFAHVGITGYPESHPTINDDLTVQSMWDKRHYATHIVSNLTFDPALVRDWLRRLRSARRDDAAAARHPGAGRARQAARHGHPHRGGGVDEVPRQEQGAVRPARGTRRVHRRDASWRSAHRRSARTGALVEGLHVFTFNQIGETEAWRTDLLAPAAATSGPHEVGERAARGRGRPSPPR